MFATIQKILLKCIGGTRNERLVRARMRYVSDRINPFEPQMRELSDEQLLRRSDELRRRLRDGESRDDIRPEAFALVREASRRARNHRQFDVQLAAGMILDEGCIAEEATGEGKTIACYPAIYMAVLEGMKVHVVTVNDYLVERDAEFARPIFELLGMTVGYVTGEMSAWGEIGPRKQAYQCDITYGTNSEFGFDFLRDNTKSTLAEQVQGPLDFAIVDEVDNILIDEARTPLILSGPAYGDVERYRKADAVAGELLQRNRAWDRANRRVETLAREIKAIEGELSKSPADQRDKIDRQLQQRSEELELAEQSLAQETRYYEVELDKKYAHMTHEGVGAAQEIAGVGSFYVGANMEWPHLMQQALLAHLVYEKDRDYVVQDGNVIIVDAFTGRLMEGRQWSDGLHQAVEAKERVPVKEESQTMATITLQNYFKLYRKLAGMTGTALTEAEEFAKIYKLDVVAVSTHRPVNRVDHNDLIYADAPVKYDALVEEVNEYSKAGRPVLVGTTSVEKSEKISEMLKRRHGIEHEVLNARPENAARESEIVTKAGYQRPLKKGADKMVGNVTIATNMAGRGTDIKLGPGVVWKNCTVPSAETLVALGVEVEELFPPGTNKCCIHCQQYDAATQCAHCFKPKIDAEFPARGRTACRDRVPCGLHIVGTERHEARRIDNQLRGRSARQGDPGSSRFFLSLRDDLMAIFAGEWTLKVLGWLGLSGDASIEDKRISKGVERAQRKVEQRNFESRKNLLEYDEVMDYQRRAFYSGRRRILQGRQLEGYVWEMIDASVHQAVEDYLGGRYPQRCIAEWGRQNLQIPLRDDQIRDVGDGAGAELEQDLRKRTRDEAADTISITLGEYMSGETDSGDWDLRGLSRWAMSRFGVNISQNQLRKMTPQDVEVELNAAAGEKIDQIDLAPIARFLAPRFSAASLADWAREKFLLDVSVEELGAADGDPQAVSEILLEKVCAAYRRREIEYPVEHAMEMTIAQSGAENVYALGGLVDWANHKYAANLTVEDFRDSKPEEIRRRLVDISQEWTDGDRLRREIHSSLGDNPSAAQAVELAQSRFDTPLKAEDLDGDIDVVDELVRVGRRFLRREMTELERFVLLQINDSSWKEHLLAMDHLKGGIGLRGFAEQDPKLAYKREGAALFAEMQAGIREKVSDMIFKVRLTGRAEAVSSVYQISNMVHEQLSGYDHLAQDMAQQQAQADRQTKVSTIIRDVPKVGRNDPCPCGSGKKYKKCCGKTA